MTTPQFDRLNTGYYNPNLKSVANPGGLAGTGAVRANFFTGFLADLMSVVADVMTQLGSVIGASNAVSTSVTNITVAAAGAARTLFVAAGKSFSAGMFIMVARTSAPTTTFMIAQVTAYNSVTGQLDFTTLAAANAGAGGFADWSVSITGALNTTTAKLNVTQAAKLTGIISPAALAADQNDWAPAGLSTAAVVRASGTAARTITGLTAGEDGELKALENVGTFDLILAANNAGSAAANRFDLTTAFVLRQKQLVLLKYDATAARWRVMGDGPAQASDIRVGTDGTVGITPADMYAALAEVTLTDAATIALDLSTGIDFVVTLGGNRTLGNPTNPKVGQTGRIRAIQDGTGTRTLAYGGNYKFALATVPALSVTAAAVDFLEYEVVTSTFIRLSLSKAWG